MRWRPSVQVMQDSGAACGTRGVRLCERVAMRALEHRLAVSGCGKQLAGSLCQEFARTKQVSMKTSTSTRTRLLVCTIHY